MRRIIEAPDRDLLTARQCAAWLNISLSQFRELLREGQFPPAIQIGKSRCHRWLWSDAYCFAYLRSANRRGSDTTEGASAGRRRGE